MPELGEILSRLGPSAQSYDPKTSRVYGTLTPSDLAAALGMVQNRNAASLVHTKYVSRTPSSFSVTPVIFEFHKRYGHHGTVRAPVDYIRALAEAALDFFVSEPRCKRCRGYREVFNIAERKWSQCPRCVGTGRRLPSKRELSKMTNIPRKKLNNNYIAIFWRLHEILCWWESDAARDIRRALRR